MRADYAIRIQIGLVWAGRNQTVRSNRGGEAAYCAKTRTKGKEDIIIVRRITLGLTREELHWSTINIHCA